MKKLIIGLLIVLLLFIPLIPLRNTSPRLPQNASYKEKHNFFSVYTLIVQIIKYN
jgi:hypothetical protein